MSEMEGMAGPLEPVADGYRSWLLEFGYRPGTIGHLMREFGLLGRWIASEGIDPGELDVWMIESFLHARRAAGDRGASTVRSFARLLEYVRGESAIAPRHSRSPVTPIDELVAEYRRWLVVERQLSASTVRRYERVARRFLEERTTLAESGNVRDLSGADVTGFLLGECARLSVGSVRGTVSDLRALLRFLRLRGFTDLALGDSVPPVASWRDTAVPKALPRGDVQRLLASCDRSTLVGARDFAVLMLLARLGLRTIEVVRLGLDDLHWRAGEITVCGKGGGCDVMPLPGDVGEALVVYLSVLDATLVRERIGSRRVFVSFRAPLRPISASIVRHLVAGACRRAGLPRIGAHRLRHTLATELLFEGASLTDIGQVLRHKSIDSTAVYAKVDLARLRQVARPWPETGR